MAARKVVIDETILSQETAPDIRNKILSQKDLYELFPFGVTKTKALLLSGQLPTVRVGKDYITTFSLIENFIEENRGREIYY